MRAMMMSLLMRVGTEGRTMPMRDGALMHSRGSNPTFALIIYFHILP